jgi:hypothetical protein
MAPLKQFSTPANQIDLTGSQQQALDQQWSDSLRRSTETSVLGSPWTTLNDSPRSYYYNPLTTDLTGGASAPVAWTAFPNRILINFPNATFSQQMGFAEGVHEDGTFGPPPDVDRNPYQPKGPRGWMDEYCEWISTRDSQGTVTAVDFTCENPDYWFSLWRFDPQRVLDLYHQLVDPAVKIEDLFLLDDQGRPVIDRSTGFAAYNAQNRWNNQPSASQKTGAVHLISPPNNLFAEVYLAAGATLLRESNGHPVTDPDVLILCSQYGTPGRNSDPHIGSEINQIIAKGGSIVSLQDPVGLYIQTPDFSGYSLPTDPKLPGDADVSECWNVVRGRTKTGGEDFDVILHARFEIPQRWKDAGVSFTVGDIQVDGNRIQFGAQITQTFKVGLRGLGLATNLPDEALLPCEANNPQAIPAPLQVQDLNLFNVGATSSAVTLVEQGTTVENIAVLAANATQQTAIAFTGGPGVQVTVTDFQNSSPQSLQVFTVTLTIDPNAPLGDRGLLLTGPNGLKGPAAPGMLSIVPPGTLGQQTVDESHPLAAMFATAAKPASATQETQQKAIKKWLQAKR